MPFPKAFVFDLDGTLIDSEQRQVEVRKSLYRRYGMPEDYDKTISTGTHKTIYWGRAKKEFCLPYTVDELIRAELNALIPSVTDGSIPPSTGLIDLLDYLKERNVLIACASASDFNYVAAVLKYLKIYDYFSAFVCGDDDVLPKPAPDPYLLACKKLGVNPSDAIGVEDTRIGSLSVVSAGMPCIGYRETAISQSADLSACFLVANTMYDILSYLKTL